MSESGYISQGSSGLMVGLCFQLFSFEALAFGSSYLRLWPFALWHFSMSPILFCYH